MDLLWLALWVITNVTGIKIANVTGIDTRCELYPVRFMINLASSRLTLTSHRLPFSTTMIDAGNYNIIPLCLLLDV